jgi:hypothetical protein
MGAAGNMSLFCDVVVPRGVVDVVVFLCVFAVVVVML